MTAPTTPSRTFRVSAALEAPRASLAQAIPRRPRVGTLLGFLLALAFAALVTPAITAERWLGLHAEVGDKAPITIRVAPFTSQSVKVDSGGFLVARGDVVTAEDAQRIAALDDATPKGPWPYIAYFVLVAVLAGIFTHHMRRSQGPASLDRAATRSVAEGRSSYGRLVRVQLTSFGLIAAFAVAVKAVLLTTSVSILVVPVALLAFVPTIALDRVVGLATGVLAALVISLLAPFDVGVAILLLVQVAVAGLVVAERPKFRLGAVVAAGGIATLFTGLTYPLLQYLTTGHLPLAELDAPAHSAWLACALGPAAATVLAVPLTAPYQLAVGEITQGKLIQLEDLSHPLLRQIAERSPGTWQHSLAMANMADIAANAIGANGRLVRVGAYFHDLGKSLHPKYFIENLEPGETSPHDQLPPEVSCDAIFAHVTEGILTARRAGLHERIVDFMHMHHGNGVLEYFWAKAREQGNPRDLTIEQFRYPGHPPQSRETAILAICDAVEAASRTLKKADAAAIDSLVQRIVYGKLHLGQLDESGLSMSDLRRVADSLRETIRHANHGRIEYPWQREQLTGPRLDSLDRPAKPDVVPAAAPITTSDAMTPLRQSNPEALADTADVRKPRAPAVDAEVVPGARISNEELAIVATSPAVGSGGIRTPDKPTSGLASGPVDRATLLGTTAPQTKPPTDAPAKIAEGTKPSFDGKIPSANSTTIGVEPSKADVEPVIELKTKIPSVNATQVGLDAPKPTIEPPKPTVEPAKPTVEPARLDTEPPTQPRAKTPSDANRFRDQLKAASAKLGIAPELLGIQPSNPNIDVAEVRAIDTEVPKAPSTQVGFQPSNPGIKPPPGEPDARDTVPGLAQMPEAESITETLPPGARTKAATLPPAKRGRAPTVPPIPGALPVPTALPAPASPAPLPPITTPPGVSPVERSIEAKDKVGAATMIGLASSAPDTIRGIGSDVRSPNEPVATPGTTIPGVPPGSGPIHTDTRGRTSEPPSLLPRIVTPPSTAPATVQGPPPTRPPAEAAHTRANGPPALRTPGTPEEQDTSAPIDVISSARDTSQPIDVIGKSGPIDKSTIAGVAPSRSDTGKRSRSNTANKQHKVSEWSDPEPSSVRPSQLDRAFDVPPAPPRTTTAERIKPPAPPGAKVPPLFAGPAKKPSATLIDEDDDDDASSTDPNMIVSEELDVTNPRLQLPLQAPPMSNPEIAIPPTDKKWAAGLAARIDAALDVDEFGGETPVIAPTPAELRALLGVPDMTRKQSLDELERLHRAVKERDSEEELHLRRPGETQEVLPDDIESAIELAPPAARRHFIGVQKKPTDKK